MTYNTSWLTDTHREVVRRHTDTGEDRCALILRHYDAPIEEVWEAITGSDRISRWFIRFTGDLRLGGTFNLECNADRRSCAADYSACSR